MANPMVEAAVQSIELEEVDSQNRRIDPHIQRGLRVLRRQPRRRKSPQISNSTAAGATTGWSLLAQYDGYSGRRSNRYRNR